MSMTSIGAGNRSGILAPGGAAACLCAALATPMPVRRLIGFMVGWLCCDLLVLGCFLGLAQPWLSFAGALLAAPLIGLMLSPGDRVPGEAPTLGTLLICLGAETLLLVLGGEGRFFYANPDWQVRDAVLRDMMVHPWPFIYATGDLLRAPLGMYLVPALAGKIGGQTAADLALLAQNSLLLGAILTVGSTLFTSARARLVALAVFLAFSGLDMLGAILIRHSIAFPPTIHLEGWAGIQYSSTITLAFWVPQHAIAGWLAMLFFLLWRINRLTLGGLLAVPALVALWSPFASIGLMPFVAYAVWHDLRRHAPTPADLVPPILAGLLALPALFYLTAGSGAVGMRLFPVTPIRYLAFQAVEVIPYLMIAAAGHRGRFGGAPLALAGATLLLAPFVQLGWWMDFMARASIPSLALLALHLAEIASGRSLVARRRRAALIALLAIGSLTGLAEIVRALTFPVSPPPRCSVSRAWDQSFAAFPKASYLVPLGEVSPMIRPRNPHRISEPEPVRCYDRVWPIPPLV